MEFRLLGGVEVVVGGRPLDLGHARQRCVLAALLVQVNRPLPVDQLVHRVWGDHPPRRARDTLYGYLSRLRAALAHGGVGPAIVRRPDGYTLTTDALDVDLHRFRDLVGRARATEEDERAADLFEQAIGLWHGEPFGTLESLWLDTLRRPRTMSGSPPNWTATMSRCGAAGIGSSWPSCGHGRGSTPWTSAWPDI